jgi:hypothetical protein
MMMVAFAVANAPATNAPDRLQGSCLEKEHGMELTIPTIV